MLRRRLRKYKPAVVVKVAPDDESMRGIRDAVWKSGMVSSTGATSVGLVQMAIGCSLLVVGSTPRQKRERHVNLPHIKSVVYSRLSRQPLLVHST